MDLEELAARIEMMEGRDAERNAINEQQSFIDKYGTKFSGDEGIGMAILAEMNRRGVPSAAVGADRVVQEILDGIREEASAILDKIKNDTATVNELIDQVQTVQQSVDAATGAGGDGTLDVPTPEIAPPPDAATLPPLPEEGAPPIPEALPPEIPPPDAPPPPVEMQGAPAPDALPPEALPPTIPSDKQVKKLIRPKPKAPAPKPATGWKPSSSLIDAVKGGI